MKTKKHTTQKKRHGLHHARSKRYQNTYLPYLPAVLFMIASIVLGNMRIPIINQAVLAYATEMSRSNLLSGTNQQRSTNGKAALTLNSKLNSAAQAKANDMADRDYWSHNTPDGTEPWHFFNQAGYKYYKAGENLAYGFLTSSQTISGWMNSASHKANMLDSEFTEVGFGFINAADYQDQGNQTIVVAMYGRPQTLGASAPAPAPAPPAAVVAQASPPPAKKPAPANSAPASNAGQPTAPPSAQQPVETNLESAIVTNSEPYEVTRIEALSKGGAPWALFAVGLASGMAVTLLFISHGLRLHKLLRSGGRLLKGGERFIYHHPVLDVTLVSFLVLMLTLAEHVGVIL